MFFDRIKYTYDSPLFYEYEYPDDLIRLTPYEFVRLAPPTKKKRDLSEAPISDGRSDEEFANDLRALMGLSDSP